ncbi:MAG: hypothetical protein B7Y80_09110 [Hyphomicrobium sp. 32-62-53]|nr:MAG: hypothetical protein B7Z29_09510 [Hyphomicrobium sp. 12-62-95]OYY00098.1 MAG: hypothetical protein B7Y80_09110 [Hyphomicrobium sp. 32-62-53]
MVAAVAVGASALWSAPEAEAKGPGRTYCFLKKCHRVKTIAETQALVGRDMTVMASHYDSCKKDRFNPCGLTSSGEPFFPERADNAASPVLPDGTIVMVWSKATKQAVVLRINNAGPYWGNRKLDLSRAAARKLGIGGVGEVTLRVLKAPTPAEARYSKNRRYEPVPGPIGQFASLDEAQGAMSVMVAEGKSPALAVASLELTAKRDGTADLAMAYQTPVVPGFSIPKGSLAAALIAQSTVERREVSAANPPTVTVTALDDVVPTVRTVTPKLTAARVVAPKRTRVKAIEVMPAVTDPLTAIATAITDLVDPPKVQKRVRSVKVVKAKRPVASLATAARKSVVVARAKPQRAARATVARAPESDQFRAGHTTYAEDRYRKPVKTAAAGGSVKKKNIAKGQSKAASSAVAAGAPPKASKQAGVTRGKKSAALRKAGGWQSSAVFEMPAARPSLTGSPRRIPAGDLKDETEKPQRGPLRRVQPSALV